jgi:signal transduction histidine kinase
MNGNAKVMLNSLVGLVEGEFVVRAWGTQRDVTARKHAEVALRLLAEAGTTLTSTLNSATIIDNLAHLVVPALADYAIIVMQDEEGNLHQVASVHVDPAQEPLMRELERLYTYNVQHPNSIVGRVLRSGKTECNNQLSEDLPRTLTEDRTILDIYHTLSPTAYLTVPLAARERTLGVLSLVTSTSGRQYTDAEITLSEELARRAALAIDNASLYEQAQQAVQTRDQFISIASHDLKTPITSIKGYADLLARRAARDGNINPRDQRAIQIIQEEAARLNQLIELLLDVSRFQRGQLVIERTQVDLCALTERLVQITRATAEQHTVELLCPAEPLIVWGDALRLEQVLQNLLQNAVKYSPQGGQVRVSVRAEADEAILSVSDEGIGIPPESLPHLFTRFYRAANIQSLSIGGLGLGLFIVRQIAEAHGGTISVTSELGVGSTFTLELPLDPRHAPR